MKHIPAARQQCTHSELALVWLVNVPYLKPGNGDHRLVDKCMASI